MNVTSLRQGVAARAQDGIGERHQDAIVPAMEVLAARPPAAPRQRRLGDYRSWVAVATALLVLPHIPGLDSDFGR
jgi:hypothetical protein